MEWHREEGFSLIRVGRNHIAAEQWLQRPDLWTAFYNGVGGPWARAGDRESTAFHSREEAEAAAVNLMLKHISELAAVIGYKVVKEQE